MDRDINSILDEFANITEEAIESGDGVDKINDLCDEVEELDDPSSAFPAFFNIMERFPNADLGSPGAMVHTMEQHIGSYEDFLEASVRRLPTYLEAV